MHFGALRVLNDDSIMGGGGFPTHSHKDMEIVTIPLSGSLAHQDSTGGNGIITSADVQIMSAGTGIYHSEFNASKTESVSLFQLWIFPEKNNLAPRYDQKAYTLKRDEFTPLVSPTKSEKTLQIFQECFISRGVFSSRTTSQYALHNSNNGVFVMVISGKIRIGDTLLSDRDSIELQKASSVTFEILEEADILLVEVTLR